MKIEEKYLKIFQKKLDEYYVNFDETVNLTTEEIEDIVYDLFDRKKDDIIWILNKYDLNKLLKKDDVTVYNKSSTLHWVIFFKKLCEFIIDNNLIDEEEFKEEYLEEYNKVVKLYKLSMNVDGIVCTEKIYIIKKGLDFIDNDFKKFTLI
jgi:hypothetical protein